MAMNRFFPILFTLVCTPAWAQSDPVQACRDAHASDAEAHISCLEQALTDVLGADPAESAGNVPADEPDEPVASDEPTGLGAEQLRAAPTPEEAAVDSVQVRIIASRYNAEGKGTFRMADGQVWTETMAAPQRWRLAPDREYAARIVRGKLGGYRLHVEGVRGMLTVRRVQ